MLCELRQLDHWRIQTPQLWATLPSFSLPYLPIPSPCLPLPHSRPFP